jgi:GH24 family phage-related lysozyme (muramidase)
MATPRKPLNKGIAAILAAGLVVGGTAMMGHLHKWEEGPKRQLVVYADKLAGNLPTVCGGLTKHITTTPIVVGEKWTEAKCDREERAAIVKVQKQLLPCFKVEVPEPIFMAATGHAWNFGASATCASSAMAAWNKEQWALGCRRIELDDAGRPIWSYVKTGRKLPNGKPEYRFVQGLANRRADEHHLCMTGVVP